MRILERMVRTPRAVRARRRVAVFAFTAMMVGSPFAPAARGQVAFAGYLARSTAAGLTVVYAQPSLGLPAGANVELGIAISQSTLEGGPAGYGLASLLWPGPTAANVPPIISGEAKKQGMPPEFPDFPQYPVRAETFFPQGPETARNNVAGGSMEARALADLADARASMNATILPATVEARSLTSAVQSAIEDGVIVSRASAAAEDISILGGFMQIDGVLTTSEVRSDGEGSTVAGNVTVGSVRVGANHYWLDEDGFHPAKFAGNEITYDLEPTNQAAKELRPFGVTVSVASPIDVVEGASGTRTLGGLVINFAPGALEGYVSALPPDVRDELRKNVALDQNLTVVVAGVTANAAANLLPPFDPPPPPPPFVPPPPPSQVLGEQFFAPPPQTPAATGPAPAASTPIFQTPIGAIDTDGLTAGLVLAALLGAMIAGSLLRRMAESALLGATVPEESCSLGIV